jgi:DNA topoisomerase-3
MTVVSFDRSGDSGRFSKLYLCEKPIQAEHVASALGKPVKHNGYLTVGDVCITYALGHLFELAAPESYEPAYKRWDLSHLPIKPKEWKLQATRKTNTQLKLITDLLKQAKEVYIATDYDREGEAIARNILAHAKVHKPTFRIKLNALDKDSILTSLNAPLPEHISQMMAEASEARRRADWLVGMNLTRYFTLTQQTTPNEERKVAYIGRVLVPTIGLVVARDREIKNYKPHAYYKLHAEFLHESTSFTATWIPPEQHSDERRRCTHVSVRDMLQRSLLKESAKVASFTNGNKNQTSPLPLDLNAAQQLASQKWGYSTKEITVALQSLYEHHRAISYPRTESRYLPSSVVGLVDETLKAFAKSDQQSQRIIDAIPDQDFSARRVFDDNKVDPAHHAIIPTRVTPDVSKMSQIELRLYHLVARFFVAQFFPDHVYHESVAEIEVGWAIFRARGRTIRQLGWKSVLGPSLTSIDQASDRDQLAPNPLPYMKAGDGVRILDALSEDKVTDPPKHFTESELIAAMKNIGRFVEDETERKALDRASGIGTAATRADIIERALKRGYLKRPRHRKTITSTEQAVQLIAMLPEDLSSPSTTAKWEMRLEQVANGVLNKDHFVEGIGSWVGGMCQPNQEEQTVSKLPSA